MAIIRTSTGTRVSSNAPNVRENRVTVSTNRREWENVSNPVPRTQPDSYYYGNPNLQVQKPATNSGGTVKPLGNQTLPLDNGNPYSGGNPVVETQQPPPTPKPPTAGELGVVKTPGRDVTKISDLVQQIPSDTIKRIAFEQLSAIELSQVLTSNTVDGIDQKYSIISNLSDIRKIFNASKQLSIMNKLSPMTGVFTIDIDSKIPSRSYILNNNLNATYSYIDENGDEITVEKGYIYVDTNGDIVIEFENIKSDEIAQVQINADGTIYEVT